jgi:hypothetical protein
MVCTRQPWSHYVRIFHRNDVLNLFAQVTAFRFFALSKTAKTVKEQPASTLFLRIYNRRWPRVSAENEMSLADILPQREQREQRKRIDPMRSRWHRASYGGAPSSYRQCGITSLANKAIEFLTMAWSMTPP